MQTTRPRGRYLDVRDESQYSVTHERLAIFKAFFDHGPLTTGMAHALCKPGIARKTFSEHLKRAKRHGFMAQDHVNLKRRDDHLHSELILNITDRAVAALEHYQYVSADDVEAWEKLNKLSRPFYHDAAMALVTASMEIGAKKKGARFLSVYEMIRRLPPEIRDKANPLEIVCGEGKKAPRLIPDTTVGIEDFNGLVAIPVELETGNNQGKYSAVKHTSIGRKARCYRYAWANDIIRDRYDAIATRLAVPCMTETHARKVARIFIEEAEADKENSGVGPVYVRADRELDKRLYIPRVKYDGRWLTDDWDKVGDGPRPIFTKKAAERSAA